jgi:hypothetical protein
MSVDVADGAAIVDGLWAYAAADTTLTVAANASGMTRYDLVFLHWVAGTQTASLRIVDGTPGAGSCEDVSNYQNSGVEWAIPLACVEVANGAASIVNADITDLREFARFRLEPYDLIDNSTLDLNSDNEIQVADAGIGIDQIAAAIAGDGLSGGAGAALDVNVDGVTIEIVLDTLQVAATCAGDGLTGGAGAALDVNVDATTIVIVGDALQVGTLTNANLADRTRYEMMGANALEATTPGGVYVTIPTWGSLSGQPTAAEGWIMDPDDDSGVVGHWKVPADMSGGAVTVYVIWTHQSVGALVCRWELEYINTHVCDGLLTATSSQALNASAALADADLRKCDSFAAAVALTAGQYFDFYLGREATHANDTLNSEAVLLGVVFSYTADM